MWTFLMAALMAAGAPQPLSVARDRQDVAALQKLADQYASTAAMAPDDANAQYRMALACSYLAEVKQELRDRKAARAAAERGIQAAEKGAALRPDAESYRLLGTLYGQAVTDLMSGLRYGPRAKNAIDKAVEKAPRSPSVFLARGVGSFYLPDQLGGGTASAIADFRKAISLDARNAEAYLWLGIALRRDNKNAEARQAFEKSLQLNPNRVWAKQQLGKIPAK